MDAWDSTGEKTRAEKRRYNGVWRGCGAPTTARGGKGDAHEYSNANRTDPHARVGARRDARTAPATWRAALINRICLGRTAGGPMAKH